MTQLELTAEELLAGAAMVYDVVVPPGVLRPGAVPSQEGENGGKEMSVQLQPLTIGAFQLIMKAAQNDPGLIPLLMIKESLVSPRFSLEQIKGFHLGLVNFLIAHIREISGLSEKKSP